MGSSAVQLEWLLFSTHVYDGPALIWGSNVHVRFVVDSVERKVSDGSFQLSFGNENSKQILDKTTASNVKKVQGIGKGAVDVSGKTKVTVDLGHGQYNSKALL
jgi:hypothetical protein